MLIKDIITLRQYLKVSFTYDAAGLPDFTRAEQRYLLPVLTASVLAGLQKMADNAGDKPEWNSLLDITRRALAPLAFLDELALKHIRLTDNGLKKTSSEHTESVFKWEYNEVKEQMQREIAICMDELWQHLFENASTYSWTDPTPYKSIFKTAKEFNDYYTLHQPYRVFPLLNSTIKLVERDFVIPAIGKIFFEELKANTTPDDDTKMVLELLKDAVASLSIHKAVEKLPVRITNYGFTVVQSASDTETATQNNAPSNQLSLLYESTKKDGLNALNQAKSYLNQKASASKFTTFFNSDYYTNPATETVSANSLRKGVFGL